MIFPKKREIRLDNIYLDPNNYRFRDHSDYMYVAREDVTNADVQARTRRIILGGRKIRRGVQDLLTSFKKVGFQPVERIKVQELEKKGKYIVVEGNRRITALKLLQEDANNDLPIGKITRELFRSVPVDVFEKDDDVNYNLIAGLNHVGGKRKWPAINIATYAKDLVDSGRYTEEDVIETFGLTKQQFNYYQRALSLIDLYKDSDFGDQFESEMFIIFDEIVRKPAIRDSWLGWDNTQNIPSNTENTQRLFGWLSTREERDDPDKENSRVRSIPPIINQGRDIRDLVKIIKDEDALETLELTGSLSTAVAGSENIKKEQIEVSIKKILKQLKGLQSQKEIINQSNNKELVNAIKILEEITSEDDYSSIKIREESNRILLNKDTFSDKHFSKLFIEDYKVFTDLRIDNLSSINVFAGNNNSGKSTLLEAIYLLTRQNDLNSFLEIQRRRGKFFPNQLSPFWIDREAPTDLTIKGIYRGKEAKIKLDKFYDTNESFDKNSYVTSLRVEANWGEYESEASIRLYEDGTIRSNYKQLASICNTAFSSPFSFKSPTDIEKFYNDAVKLELDKKIVDFIQKSGLDHKISDVVLSRERDVTRLFVQHKHLKPAPDITSFGDGLQRIYYIGLHFAAAQNGILLIDELENAIHHELLIRFTKFIQLLAKEFNVQVFLTSHSKECINAFVDNDYMNDDISFYRINRRGQEIECDYTPGYAFARLVDSFNLDLRG